MSGQKLNDNEVTDISGHTTEGDGGGGNFYWDSTSTATDDNGTIVKLADTTTGRFIRVDQTRITVEMFGATGDGSTDDRTAILAAITFIEGQGGGTVYLSAASYNIGTTGIVIDSQSVTLEGEGMGGQTAGKNGSRIIYTGTGAAIQLTADGTNAWGTNLRNLHIDGSGTGYIGLKVGNDDGTVNVSWWGMIENVYITGFEIGRMVIGCQNGYFSKVHCEANDIGTIYRRGAVTPGGLANTATVEISCRNYNNAYYGKVLEQAFSIKFIGCTDETSGYKNVLIGPAAWVLSTAYRLGEEVTNGGNIYTCTTAGTSAGSGGPSGTGTSIADNTVIWDYVSAVGSISVNFDGGWEEAAGDTYAVEQNYGSVKFRDYNFGSSDKLLDLVGGSILLDECFYAETGTNPDMRIGAGTSCQVETLGESYTHFDIHPDAKFSWGGRNRLTADTDPSKANAISGVTDPGGGDITIASTAHGLVLGDTLTVVGTTSYNAAYTVTVVNDANSFDVTATYVASETGYWATQAYNRGDMVTRQGDSGFANGYPFGWICTASGTPGTWHEWGSMRILNKITAKVPADATGITLSQYDHTVTFDLTTATPTFVRLPLITSALIGKDITLCLISTGTLTYSAGVGQTIEGGGSQTLTAQWENKTFRAYSATDWIQVD